MLPFLSTDFAMLSPLFLELYGLGLATLVAFTLVRRRTNLPVFHLGREMRIVSAQCKVIKALAFNVLVVLVLAHASIYRCPSQDVALNAKRRAEIFLERSDKR